VRLATEFIRLPLIFDVEKLAQEVLAFDQSEWLPHVQGFAGNTAIPLISLNGEMNDDFNGPMKVTEKLKRSPYIRQVLASFDEVFGRSRLMGLAGGYTVPEHRDVNYHWYKRVRIHIPVITNQNVLFYCGDRHIHMAAGESWIFDSWKKHRVENRSKEFRIHIVIDAIGSSKFWEMVGESEWRCAKHCRKPATINDRFIPYEEGNRPTIPTEKYNAPLVMHPGEVDALIMDILVDVKACRANYGPVLNDFEKSLQNFRLEWHRLWSLYGQSEEGWPYYKNLISSVRLPQEHLQLASNQGSAIHTFGARVLAAAINVHLADQYTRAG
jgi:hypothetical protein